MPALGSGLEIGLGVGAPAAPGGIDVSLLVLAALVILALNAAWYIVRWPWAGTAKPDRLTRKLGATEGWFFTPASTLPAVTTPPSPAPATAHKPGSTHYTIRPASDTATLDAVADDEMTAVPWPAGAAVATPRPAETEEPPPLGYLLRVTSDPSLPPTLPIPAPAADSGKQSPIRIGRHRQNNTVVIGDKNISREHAQIVQKEGRLYLRDNASTGGTYLNWRRLRPGEELLLRNIDIVGFGEVLYKLHLDTI